MRKLFAALCVLLVYGCAGSPGPTPLIVYVTPVPSAVASLAAGPTPSPVAIATPSPVSSPTPRPTPIVTPKPWGPKGYEVIDFGAGPIAFRWLKSGFSCTLPGSSCWGMYVIPKEGCSTSLSVDLSITSRDGTVVDSAADFAGSVAPGQKAKLTFTTFEDSASSASITDITCF